MPDEMFFSSDERSLVRGKRVARRTDTCRPCLLQRSDSLSEPLQGVVLDVTPFGMLVRTVAPLPVGTKLFIQLMRDEAFRHPLAEPQTARVVREDIIGDGLVDLGIELYRERLAHIERTSDMDEQPATPQRSRLDVAVGGPVGLEGR